MEKEWLTLKRLSEGREGRSRSAVGEGPREVVKD